MFKLNGANLTAFFLVCLLLPLGYSKNVFAYTIGEYCNGVPTAWYAKYYIPTYHIETCGFSVGDPDRADVEAMFEHWNDVGSMSDMFWNYTSGYVPCNQMINHADGQNQIYYSDAIPADGAVGYTWVRYSSMCYFPSNTQYIIEADIALSADEPWELGAPACNHQGYYDLQHAVLHEMGHAIGLGHTKGPAAIMAPTMEGGLRYCYDHAIQPNPDDANGGRFLAGTTNSSQNLAISSFKSEGWGIGKVRPTIPDNTLVRCPGEYFSSEWTISNLGANAVELDIRYYFSLNNYISTSDIPSTTVNNRYVSRGDLTFKRDIIVPFETSQNTLYYVGLFADFNSQINESIETDNRSYAHSQIYIRQNIQCQ